MILRCVGHQCGWHTQLDQNGPNWTSSDQNGPFWSHECSKPDLLFSYFGPKARNLSLSRSFGMQGWGFGLFEATESEPKGYNILKTSGKRSMLSEEFQMVVLRKKNPRAHKIKLALPDPPPKRPNPPSQNEEFRAMAFQQNEPKNHRPP